MPNEGMRRQLLGLLTTFFSSPLFLRTSMAFAFEKLEVYQKAVSFADRICQVTEAFSRGYGFLCQTQGMCVCDSRQTLQAASDYPVRFAPRDST